MRILIFILFSPFVLSSQIENDTIYRSNVLMTEGQEARTLYYWPDDGLLLTNSNRVITLGTNYINVLAQTTGETILKIDSLGASFGTAYRDTIDMIVSDTMFIHPHMADSTQIDFQNLYQGYFTKEGNKFKVKLSAVDTFTSKGKLTEYGTKIRFETDAVDSSSFFKFFTDTYTPERAIRIYQADTLLTRISTAGDSYISGKDSVGLVIADYVDRTDDFSYATNGLYMHGGTPSRWARFSGYDEGSTRGPGVFLAFDSNGKIIETTKKIGKRIDLQLGDSNSTLPTWATNIEYPISGDLDGAPFPAEIKIYDSGCSTGASGGTLKIYHNNVLKENLSKTASGVITYARDASNDNLLINDGDILKFEIQGNASTTCNGFAINLSW